MRAVANLCVEIVYHHFKKELVKMRFFQISVIKNPACSNYIFAYLRENRFLCCRCICEFIRVV